MRHSGTKRKLNLADAMYRILMPRGWGIASILSVSPLWEDKIALARHLKWRNDKKSCHIDIHFVARYAVLRHNEDTMPRQVSQNEIEVILRAVARFPEGGSVEDIRGALSIALPRRTLQRRLAMLVEQQRLIVEGRTRGSRYRLPRICR